MAVWNTVFYEFVVIPAVDRQLMASVDIDQLPQQAKTLLDKRLREVSNLAPATTAGREHLFREYAGSCWPEGDQRHLRDAHEFMTFMDKRGERICISEYWRISMLLKRRRWLVDLGSIFTRRGWRVGIAARIPWRGRQWDLILTLG